MQATITYLAGKSCWIGKSKFKLNAPVIITDPTVIQRCKDTAGFSVTMTKPAKPEKVVRKVVQAAGERSSKKRPHTD